MWQLHVKSLTVLNTQANKMRNTRTNVCPTKRILLDQETDTDLQHWFRKHFRITNQQSNSGFSEDHKLCVSDCANSTEQSSPREQKNSIFSNGPEVSLACSQQPGINSVPSWKNPVCTVDWFVISDDE
jgi:hypothetical protein